MRYLYYFVIVETFYFLFILQITHILLFQLYDRMERTNPLRQMAIYSVKYQLFNSRFNVRMTVSPMLYVYLNTIFFLIINNDHVNVH